jgi:hypothetical protein
MSRLPADACSYGRAGGNDGTSWDHHDPVSNVIVVAVDVARFAFGRYHNTVSDTDVFVDNGLFNNAMSSYAQRGKVRIGLRILVLVKIRAHQMRLALKHRRGILMSVLGTILERYHFSSYGSLLWRADHEQ